MKQIAKHAGILLILVLFAAAEAGFAKRCPKVWRTAVAYTVVHDGPLRFHHTHDGRVLLEVPASSAKDYGLGLQIHRGIDAYHLSSGAYAGLRLIRFQRVAQRVLMIHRNPRFQAAEGAPIAEAVEQDFGHSVLAAFDVLTECDNRILVDVTPFLLSDDFDLLSYADAGVDATVDDRRSFVSELKTSSRAVAVDVELTYAFSGIDTGLTVSDYRSLPLGIRYLFIDLPAEPMRSRLADERMGFYVEETYDLTDDLAEDPRQRVIRRVRLEKASPIVFVIDKNVPEIHRDEVARGIETWNPAFQEAGFLRAVKACLEEKCANCRSEACTEDQTKALLGFRVRWLASYNGSPAFSGDLTDPRSGEILASEVRIPSFLGPAYFPAARFLAAPGTRVAARGRPGVCRHAAGIGRDVAFMPFLGATSQEVSRQAVVTTVIHEVGHSLGLDHNFRGSAGTPLESLHDRSFTDKHGVSASVMDYAPINIAPPGQEQGDYWNLKPGRYDRLAIRYGYKRFYHPNGAPIEDPKAELSDLIRDAPKEEAFDGGDGLDALGSWLVDPRIQAWDLSADPVAFAEQRARQLRAALEELEQRVTTNRYQDLLAAFHFVHGQYWRSLKLALPAIGGLYTSRAERDDPQDTLPFAVIPAADQKRALKLILDHGFGANAPKLTPDLLNKLAPRRWNDFGTETIYPTPLDVPIHDVVRQAQEAMLAELLFPGRIARILDNEVRSEDLEIYWLSDHYKALREAIWSDMEISGTDPAPKILSLRRGLQMTFLDLLIRQATKRSGDENAPLPDDAHALARDELGELETQIASILKRPSADFETAVLAHLREAQKRIQRALESRLELR